jgi:hypothetical protein
MPLIPGLDLRLRLEDDSSVLKPLALALVDVEDFTTGENRVDPMMYQSITGLYLLDDGEIIIGSGACEYPISSPLLDVPNISP